MLCPGLESPTERFSACVHAEALAKLSELRCLEIKHNWVADVGTTAICDAIIGQNALNRQSGISSAQTRTVPPLCEVAALNLCTRVVSARAISNEQSRLIFIPKPFPDD